MRRLLSLVLLAFLVTPGFAQRVITTVAGADWLFPGDGQPALNAPINGTNGMDVAVDRNGNYYIADYGKASASTLPLPTILAGSSIVIGGQQVPLVFASNGQVNAMIPYGIGVNTSQQVIVARGNSISVPQAVTLAAAAPGIFQVPGSTQGAILVGADLVDAAHPAQAGTVLTIYCTGLGEVTPAVETGSPAPTAPLAKAINVPTVTIGGVPADIQFAGLTPGSVGLYQVNAVVPAVTPGNSVPVVITSAGQQSPPATIAVR